MKIIFYNNCVSWLIIDLCNEFIDMKIEQLVSQLLSEKANNYIENTMKNSIELKEYESKLNNCILKYV